MKYKFLICNSILKMQKTYTDQTLLTNVDAEEARELNLIVEYKSLRAFAPSGVYTIPSIQDIYKWYGLVFIRGGEYQGAVFKFRLEIPNDYPSSAPSVYFISHVFHPLVAPETGLLNISPKFPIWTPRKDFIFLVLNYIKYIFHNKDYWKDQKYIRNSAASSIYESDEAQFLREVRTCIMASIDDLQDNYDDFPIRFKPYNSFHKKVLEEIRGIDKKAPVREQSEAFLTWFRKTFI